MAGIGKSVATRIFSSLLTSTTDVPKEAQARVTRVDEDGVPWVAVAGSDEETPANGSVTSEAQVGQTVRVSVQGGRLSIVGNSTSPSVGGEYVRGVVAPVEELVEETSIAVRATSAVANAANTVAQAAQAIAQATNQHFWYRATDPDEDGAGTGAFVTDEAQETFLQAIKDGIEPTEQRPLHNLLMNSEGFLLRAAKLLRATFTESGTAFYDGLGDTAANIIARFGVDGAQIGRNGEAHINLTPTNMQVVAEDASYSFDVSVGARENNISDFVNQSITAVPFTHTLEYTPKSGSIVVYRGVENSYNPPSGETTYAYTVSGKTLTVTDSRMVGADGYLVRYTATDFAGVALTLGSRRNVGVGLRSAAFGQSLEASGLNSHAEGFSTTASGDDSHAEGNRTTASGSNSHAEGYHATASGDDSHAEGAITTASGDDSHAEGFSTTASGDDSHAEGRITTASGHYAHAEGHNTTASGINSHAQNRGTIAAGSAQTALGEYNASDTTSALIIGNGTSDTARSNALTVAWDGTVEMGTDVPWTLLTLDSACHAYNDATANAPRYRRWGQLVTITGIIAPTAEVAAGGTLAIATLPAGVRPHQQINVKCQGSGRSHWCLNITVAGVMTANRYGDESGAQAMATSFWMPFTVTYLV